MKPSKYYVKEELRRWLNEQPRTPVRLLELGCGTSAITLPLVREFDHLTYVGIEPDPEAFLKAQKNLEGYPNAIVLQGFAYGEVSHEALREPFDLVLSLSVLEHVKNLSRFMAYASGMLKPEGQMIHLYDLGHALYPSSYKEWIQTRLCASRLLALIPEQKVARYLATEDVERIIEQSGCRIERTTFHNLRSHVSLVKAITREQALQLFEKINELELQSAPLISNIRERERLFPSICMWARKNESLNLP